MGGSRPMSGARPRSRPEQRAALVAAATLVGLAGVVRAEPLHGRLELQDAASFAREGSLDAALGAKGRNDALADLRLTWEPSWGRWSASVHYDVTVTYGDGVRLARARTSLPP